MIKYQLHNIEKTLADLTATQQKQVFEFKIKQQLEEALYVTLYNCYKKDVNIYDAAEKQLIIKEAADKNKTLYDKIYTIAYLRSIYIKTCKSVIDEYKQAQLFNLQHAPPPQSNSSSNQSKASYKTAAKVIISILIILYTIILNL